MRKLLVVLLTLISYHAISQTPDPKKNDLARRAADHLMLQFSSDHWSGAPDSISSKIGGFSRGANVYLMLDKPFKGNPKLSVAFGLGVGTSHIFFKKMTVDIASTNPILPFIDADTNNYFKKYKLATTYLEIPLEFRYSANPENPNKGFKFAVGIKGGFLLNAHTKGKILKNGDGQTINNFTRKESIKTYFNNNRLAATARIGFGNYTLFGAYTITSLFKDGVAAEIKPFQIGITLSGL